MAKFEYPDTYLIRLRGRELSYRYIAESAIKEYPDSPENPFYLEKIKMRNAKIELLEEILDNRHKGWREKIK